MLNYLSQQLAAAYRNGKLIHSERGTVNGVNVITKLNRLTYYRGVPLLFNQVLVKDTEKSPLYMADGMLVCEKTGKILDTTPFRTIVNTTDENGKVTQTCKVNSVDLLYRVQCLITPGYDHERKVKQRQDMCAQRMIQTEFQKRKTELNELPYSANDKAYIEKWLQTNFDPNNFAKIKLLIKILSDYRPELTGEDLVTRNINLGDEAKYYVMTCYRTAVKHLMAASNRAPNLAKIGFTYYTNHIVVNSGQETGSRSMLGLVVRQFFSEIWRNSVVPTAKSDTDYFVTSDFFIYVMKFLVDFYAMKTGVSYDEMTRRIKRSDISYNNRKARREYNGRNYASSVPDQKINMFGTVNDAIGGILDDIMTQPTLEIKPPKSGKSKKRKNDKFEDGEPVTKPKPELRDTIPANVDDDDQEPEQAEPAHDDVEPTSTEESNLGSMSEAFGDLML